MNASCARVALAAPQPAVVARRRDALRRAASRASSSAFLRSPRRRCRSRAAARSTLDQQRAACSRVAATCRRPSSAGSAGRAPRRSRRVGHRRAARRCRRDLRRRGRGERQHRRRAQRVARPRRAPGSRGGSRGPTARCSAPRRSTNSATRRRCAAPRGSAGRASRSGVTYTMHGAVVADQARAPAAPRRRHRAVERADGDAARGQLVDLILHQRDQRRHHQRHARQAAAPAAGSTATCRRRSASPRACAAGEHRDDHGALAGTQRLEAEDAIAAASASCGRGCASPGCPDWVALDPTRWTHASTCKARSTAAGGPRP